MLEKLGKDDNKYFITNSKGYSNTFTEDEVRIAFDFAWEMVWGEGHQKNEWIGSNIPRTNCEKFANIFQGKLGEIGFYKEAVKVWVDFPEVDFDVNGRNIWDSGDFEYDCNKYSVKTIPSYGDLFLLPTGDWSEDGSYKYGKDQNNNLIPVFYDYHVLMKVSPDTKGVLKSIKKLYSDEMIKVELECLMFSKAWTYQLTGYINNLTLVKAIDERFILPKGALVNGKEKMKTENYYIQSGNFENFENLISWNEFCKDYAKITRYPRICEQCGTKSECHDEETCSNCGKQFYYKLS